MAKVFSADHARRIDLPGVGPAPRPVDIDQAQSGFNALRTLRIYRFEPVGTIAGHAEEDEVFIVLLRGEIELQIRSDRWSQSDARFVLMAADASASRLCAAYLPPHAEYLLTPRSSADVAYARALPHEGLTPVVIAAKAIDPAAGARLLLDDCSHAERLQLQLWQCITQDAPAEWTPLAQANPGGEALIHLRSEPTHTATVNAPGLSNVGLDPWDTLLVCGGEPATIQLGAHSSAVGLVVSAA